MFLYLLLLASSISENITQTENLLKRYYGMPSISPNTDLLITLEKPQDSPSLLFMLQIPDLPEFDYNPESGIWSVSMHDADVDDWTSNAMTSKLRLDHKNVKKYGRLGIGVYKASSLPVNYTISFTSLNISECETYCNEGTCISGKCICRKIPYAGEYCGHSLKTLYLGNLYSMEIESWSWNFYLLPNSENPELLCEFKKIKPGMEIYELQSDSGHHLPSMVHYEIIYYFGENEESFKAPVLLMNKKYKMWGFYCNSDRSCEASIRFSYLDKPMSKTVVFSFTLLLFVFLFVIVFATVKIVRKLKEIQAAKIAYSLLEEKKMKLRTKFPDKKYEESEEKNTCSICLEDFKNGSIVRILLCMHLFHANCIDEWCASNSKCPLCKRDVFVEVEDASASVSVSVSVSLPLPEPESLPN